MQILQIKNSNKSDQLAQLHILADIEMLFLCGELSHLF